MPHVNIITWNYIHDASFAPQYPHGKVDDPWLQEVYWRCVYSLFHSAACREHAWPIRNILFRNKPPPSVIDGLDIAGLTEVLSINAIDLKPRTNIPPDYFHAVTTQFYMVDILEDLARYVAMGHLGRDDVFILLDSDCLFINPISESFIKEVQSAGAMGVLSGRSDQCPDNDWYGMGFPEIKQISREICGQDLEPFSVTGGEFFAFTGKELAVLAQEMRNLLDQCIARHHQGRNKFLTEEVMFGHVFTKQRYALDDGSRYIARVYTHQGFPTEVGNHLMLWHLLTEKNRMILYYFNNMEEMVQKKDSLAEFLRTVVDRVVAGPAISAPTGG